MDGWRDGRREEGSYEWKCDGMGWSEVRGRGVELGKG